MNFANWQARVHVKMRREFNITAKDSGLSEDDLRRWWREGLSPSEFVKWLGEKFDLTPRGEWGW